MVTFGAARILEAKEAETGTRVRKGYKQTEVGIIPEDWEIAPLSSITPPNSRNGIVDGPFGSNLKTIHYRNSGIPIITSGYVTDGKFHADKYLYVDQSKFNEEKRSAVRPGDIVMAKIGERCGASAILPVTHETGILSGNALKITVDPQRYSTTYIWQILWALYSSGKVESLRTVGAQPAISMANLKKHNIPLPPTKAEQEAIAAALSAAYALIESLEQFIAKKRQIKQGAMQELLTGKKRLPRFSGEWKEKHLGNTAILKARIGWQGLTTTEYMDSGDYYLVTGTEFENGYVDWDKCHHVSESRYRQDKYIQLREHDVLVTKDGTIGKTALVMNLPKPATLNSGVFVIRPSENAFHPEFFYYLLSSDVFTEFLVQLSAGSTINHLYQKDFVNFVYKTPPTNDEQIAIAAILSDMDADIAALEKKLTKARQIKQGMMQELLTGRIRLV